MLLCNIVSLAAQRSSARDKTKQSQSNLSSFPPLSSQRETLHRRVYVGVATEHVLEGEMEAPQISPADSADPLRLIGLRDAQARVHLRDLRGVREDPRTIARQDTQLDRKDTDQESQNCPVSGRLCASELDSVLLSPFCEVAHNFAGQMTKLLKRFEAINNLPAESQFQRARYLSIMISEYDANPPPSHVLQASSQAREKTSPETLPPLSNSEASCGFLDTPINTRERNNLLNDCTTCGWRQLILDIIPTATFLTKERLADIFTRDVISVIISANSLIVSATLFSNGPFYELSTRLYQLVLRLCASINDTRTMSTVVRNQYWLVGLHGKGFRQLDKEYMEDRQIRSAGSDDEAAPSRIRQPCLPREQGASHPRLYRPSEGDPEKPGLQIAAGEGRRVVPPASTDCVPRKRNDHVGAWTLDRFVWDCCEKADCAFSAYDLLFEDNIPQYPTGVSSAKIDARLADLGIDYYPAPAALPSAVERKDSPVVSLFVHSDRGISNRRVLDDHCDSINHISGPDSFWISPARADNEECDPQTVLDQWKELHCSERACSASLTSLTVQGITQKENASSISVSSSTFAGVTSVGDGGVFFSTSSGSISLSSCSFTSCSCGSGHQGKWVFVKAHSLGTLLDPDNWASTTASLASHANDSLLMGRIWPKPKGARSDRSLLFYLIDFKAATITTGDGKDAKGCGQSGFHCSSIDEAWSHLKDSLAFSSSPRTPTSLSLVPAVSSEARDSSLFSVVGGSLAVKSCSFVDFSLVARSDPSHWIDPEDG
ncbi:hypothetical protein BLNAU_4136 [Blattamonas nauphoetae]|uniref:Uncharacterized protein n=1 Tax=Blattamonas nauphoetae TaxID=2049346 RepID=A0ABQ9YAN8_9EUKA|nr:hypothetical protein BLNAU_4136 [Blattamonas nauphoetae]